ncbi:MAG: hypothetical protein JWP61_2036, partial [Friedmanniella sp.]|nr:hypothetical protein [Friedmanniella sp.]
EPVGQHYVSLWAAGVNHMQTQASPMDLNDGVRLIFVTAVGLIWVLTDLIVSGLRRPAWAIAPPAALFLVPALGLGEDTGVVSFVLLAVGYVGVLLAGGLNTSRAWTRGLSQDSASVDQRASPVVWRAAGLLTLPAILLVLLLGVALPTISLPGSGFGNGPGGNGPLQLTDPTLDLKRNLTQPTDKVVLRYRSDGPGGVYLRLASLPQLSNAGWGNVRINLSEGSRLPEVPGLAREPSEERHTTIQVLDFGSQYLPLPYAPRSFAAAGSWSYDPGSLTVVDSSNSPDVLRNLSYTVTSLDIAPSNADLSRSAAGTPNDSAVTAVIPKDLPDSLIEKTRSVIKGTRTPAEQAAAIQAYLRSGEFTYSTERLPGNGYQALENFLTVDRRGYCEQFASAMAMMARVAGIPSRVSVGFLPGRRNGDTWEVSIRDMHAWPELYFANYGWVRYEPTPASLTGSAPSWTLQDQSQPQASESAAPSTAPSSAQPSASSDPSAAAGPTTQTTDGSTGFPWGRTLLGSGVGLLALALLAAPATVRLRRRSTRLSQDGLPADRVEAAWAEIRDTAVDHGWTWPEGSPRTIGRTVGGRLEDAESASMTRVATLVERSRYAPDLGAPDATDGLAETTESIRRGIVGSRTGRQRLRALLLPRSLWRRPRD